MVRLLRSLSLLLVLGAATAWRAGPVAADHDTVEIPNLVGRAPEETRQALEALGLTPVLVPVAGPTPGRVERLDPVAGTRVAVGSQVVARYGIALRLETRVPDLRGRLLSDIGAELEGAYALDVELVFVPGAPEGQILDQQPQPGQTLWYRGVLSLRVSLSKPSGPSAVIVPALVGRPEAEAVEHVKSLGLNVVLDYRMEPNQPAGLVLVQDPRSGAEVLAGGTVFLRISGSPPAEPPPAIEVPVPNLVGLDMNVALHAAQASGFVPQLAFQVAPGYTPWSVIAQDPPADTPRPPGAAVGITIALSGPAPQNVSVPSLFALTQGQALQILGSLGLAAQVSLENVGFPAGRVFAQKPTAGALVPKGSAVRISVSKGSPGPGNPPPVQVPQLVGLSALQAFAKLQAAGLSPTGLQHLAPNQPVDTVTAQTPAPGAFLPVGSEVRFYVPIASIVPTLLHKTRSQAIGLLQNAGFNADPQGPAFGMGTTVVIAQSAPAGVPLARGGTVAFAFKFTQGGGMPVKVQVPNVVGMPKQEAIQTLQAKGLGVDVQHQGPALPGPGTKVVAQGPPAGALVNPGTVVQIVYVEIGGPQGMTQVPPLGGKTLAEAQQLLAAANLGIDPQQQGPNFPGGIKQVVGQQPAPGAIVAVGSAVKVFYVQQPPGPPQLISVPSLIHKTKAQATAMLSALGLAYKFNGPGGNPSKLRVILQGPAPGTKLAPGSQVTMVVIPTP